MATTSPWALDGVTYTGQEFRRLVTLPGGTYGGSELSLRQGVLPGGTAWQVTTAGSPVVATVRRGHGTIIGPAGVSYYWVLLESDETHTLAAANTQARIDIIVVEIVGEVAASRLIAGTPAATPSAPATPTGTYRIASLNVATSGSGGAVTVTNDLDYTVARGGVLPYTGTAPATDAHAGLVIFDTAANRLWVRNGANSAYLPVYQPRQVGSLTTLTGWPEDVAAGQRPLRYNLDTVSGSAQFQGRMQRAVSNQVWSAGVWVQLTGVLPAAVRPVGGAEYGVMATSEGPAQWRWWPADNFLYGWRAADTTYVAGAGWVSLGGVSWVI